MEVVEDNWAASSTSSTTKIMGNEAWSLEWLEQQKGRVGGDGLNYIKLYMLCMIAFVHCKGLSLVLV